MYRCGRLRRWCTLLGLSLTWGAALGCQSRTTERRALGSGNPFDRAQGAVRVTRSGDDGAVHKLVDLLEDSDSGVRMYAILALRRICGEDYGYRYYASADERSTAVERWREALRSGVMKRQAVPWADGTVPAAGDAAPEADNAGNGAAAGASP